MTMYGHTNQLVSEGCVMAMCSWTSLRSLTVQAMDCPIVSTIAGI